MKNTFKSITTICFLFILLSCNNRPLSKGDSLENDKKTVKNLFFCVYTR